MHTSAAHDCHLQSSILSMYQRLLLLFFFFNDTATTEIYTYGHTLSLHDALPISTESCRPDRARGRAEYRQNQHDEDQIGDLERDPSRTEQPFEEGAIIIGLHPAREGEGRRRDDAPANGREQHRGRSEERRVGQEWVRTCRAGWSPYH